MNDPGSSGAPDGGQGAERAGRARKLAGDLRGTADDLLIAWPGSWRDWPDDGEPVSAILDQAAGHFARGEHAQGISLARDAAAVLSGEADDLRGRAEVREADASRYGEGDPWGDLAGSGAREARERAARLSWQASRAARLAGPDGGPGRADRVREAAPGTGPLAAQGAAARQLAADVRKSPVGGTYFSYPGFPGLFPTDTRHMAAGELEFAAARFDQGNEPLGRSHLANARRLLDSRVAAASRGGWERLNDEQPGPADFQAEAFHHANRAGMIEDSLNAVRPGGGRRRARARRAARGPGASPGGAAPRSRGPRP
jgi:hypothetical protein